MTEPLFMDIRDRAMARLDVGETVSSAISAVAAALAPRSKMPAAPSSSALAIVLEPKAHNGSLH